jgi:adenine deaminase
MLPKPSVVQLKYYLDKLQNTLLTPVRILRCCHNAFTAIEKGLDKSIALKALTEIPAQILGMENQIGSLKTGSLANFIITSGEVFDKKSKIYENWIQGQRSIIKEADLPKIEGTYDLSFTSESSAEKIEIQIKEKAGKYSLEAKKDSLKLATKNQI